MKNILFNICIGWATCLLISCINTRDGKYPVFPDAPTQKAHEGFQWEVVSGAGLKFWAQYNPNIHVITDDILQEAIVENKDSLYHSKRTVIKIFPLENGKIEDVLNLLAAKPGWDHSQTCKFQKQTCGKIRQGVTRYVLVPDGDYARQYERQSAQEPIPSTCNGWGVGNSGMRYFEIHDNQPDKALFIEIGQDMPLFDPESIVQTDMPVQ